MKTNKTFPTLFIFIFYIHLHSEITKHWTAFASLLATVQGTSLPENALEVTDKCTGKAPETLYVASQVCPGVDVIDAGSSLNHSWDLYLRAMRTAPADHILRHSTYLQPWRSMDFPLVRVLFYSIWSHVVAASTHVRRLITYLYAFCCSAWMLFIDAENNCTLQNNNDPSEINFTMLHAVSFVIVSLGEKVKRMLVVLLSNVTGLWLLWWYHFFFRSSSRWDSALSNISLLTENIVFKTLHLLYFITAYTRLQC